MTSQIILVRHARPVIDQREAAQNWVLEQEAVGQVVTMTGRLLPFGVDSVVTSPESKALETGRIIAGELHIPISVNADLREQGDGQVPWIESPEAFRAVVADHFARPSERVLGAESSEDAVDRFEGAVNRVRRKGSCLVLVTHGRIMCGYLARVLDLDPMSIWPTLLMPDALVLDLDAGRWHRIEEEKEA